MPNDIMPNVIMLSVLTLIAVMLDVIILSVMALINQLLEKGNGFKLASLTITCRIIDTSPYPFVQPS
jgi:hypothetical protein